MHGILSYEERVRLERANGLRPENECAPCGGNCCHDESDLTGMTYAEMAKRPQPLRATCPTTKVIVPVVPFIRVHEAPKDLTPVNGSAEWRVVDFNKCDARNQGLTAIPDTAKVSHAKTVVTATDKVVDNVFDDAYYVQSINTDIEADKAATQPILTDGSNPVNPVSTDNGKTSIPYTEANGEDDETVASASTPATSSANSEVTENSAASSDETVQM